MGQQPTNLDMDVLRSFVTGIDLGSFAKAGQRLGRSPSAISLQLRKLEDQVGRPLFRRNGRGLAPTEAGEMLLGYARRLLDLNDAALDAVAGPSLEGWVRLGVPQDVAETDLPAILARFARLHPAVRIEAHVERDADLRARLEAGTLDLALVWDAAPARPESCLAERPMGWIGPRAGWARAPGEPLPLVLFGPPCLFRRAATDALDAAGIPWRVAFSSPGLSGLWAAVAAGLGLTVRTAQGLPAGLQVLGPEDGLPNLPILNLGLRYAAATPDPTVARLGALLRETLAEAA